VPGTTCRSRSTECTCSPSCGDGYIDKANILIVDDLPEKLLVFKTVLEDLDQNLIMVRSGSEALREVLQRDFAVILLDVNMPDIDGIETASLIRGHRKSAHTPIIFITAYADEMQTAQGYSLGAVDYILSPVMPDVLRSKVKVFVELYQAQQRIKLMADERVARAQAEAARHAAEENTLRADFMAHASRELGASLDLEEGMRRLLELAVPHFAPAATLLVDDESQGQWLCLSAEGFTQFTYDQLPRNLAASLQGVLSEGRAIALGAPLRIGERRLGALLLDARETDLATLDELTTRAAMAFDNARLYGSLQREIARSRAAEENLQEAARRKDEFLAMLSHELRNPLAPIRTAVEVIRRVAPPDPTLTMAREAVERQVGHLVRLVEELLDVSRISEGRITLKKEQIELGKVISHSVETARPLIEARGQQLSVRLPRSPVWVFGDAVRLSQVLANLLNNSAKYTPEGGRIEIVATAREGEAVVEVKDDGEGIDAQLLPRVFDLFVQGQRSLDRSQGGLGLGLTLVKRLVELHQGRVEAESAGAGRGSTFKIFLPCLTAVANRSEKVTPIVGAKPLVSGRRILVVDDNVDAAETVAAYLRLEGHHTKVVTESAEVMASTRVFEPQVVVLDIGLPGLDGYEIARQLRTQAHTRDTLLIAVTGYGREEDRARAAAAGFDCHFVKPADPVEIQAAIDRGRGQAELKTRAGAPPG
jgi:signal transduction histidine kinase/DNA-binding response OmpR family regulator